MNQDLIELSELISEKSHKIRLARDEIGKLIVGQTYLVERLLLGLLADGHILIEGVPGLAKTSAVKALAGVVGVKFSRIQFTPDILPADLIGTLIYHAATGRFEVKKGPIFGNLILADEINRAPAKVQSALLEAMEERHVTIDDKTYELPSPFLVMATQNPIEQEGTYPLPEAQMDRFMLKLKVGYPEKNQEREIMGMALRRRSQEQIMRVLYPEDIVNLRELVQQVYVDERIQGYILNLVLSTREPEAYNLPDLKDYIHFGASPRGSISLALACRTLAFLRNRAYVIPDDVKDLAPDVLRHRIILTYEAEAENLSTDDIISMILQRIEVP